MQECGHHVKTAVGTVKMADYASSPDKSFIASYARTGIVSRLIFRSPSPHQQIPHKIR